VTIVVISVVMDSVQEMRSQNAVNVLQAKVALRARAVRNGQESQFCAFDACWLGSRLVVEDQESTKYRRHLSGTPLRL
jgi:hypothetical protein